MNFKYVIICLIILIVCSYTALADVSFGKVGGEVDITDARIIGEITDTGENTLEVTLEGSGPVGLEILGRGGHFVTYPMSETVKLEPGEPQVVTFNFVPSDVKGDYTSEFTLLATSSTGQESEYRVHYTIKDAESMNEKTAKAATTNSNAPQTFIFVLFVLGLLLVAGIKMSKK